MFMFKRTLVASAISASISASVLLGTTGVAHAAMDEVDSDDLEIIVISGSRTERLLKDVAGSISVLTAQDMEHQVIKDMSQLFKYDPSVQVTGKTGDAQNIIVRGMGGDRVLMIKDGMRLNEGYGANGLNDIVGRGFIETDILKQVEVAKGAASSLYGSDALSGIVVFTTKDASDYLKSGESFAGKVKVGHDAQGSQSSVSGLLAFESGDFEHLLNVSRRQGEESQNYNETKPELEIDSTSVFYKAKYNINETDFISFSADVWDQQVDGDIAYGLLGNFRTLTGYDILTESSKSDKENKSFQLRYQSHTPTAIYDQLNVSVYSNQTTQTDIEYGQIDIDANFGFPLIELRDMWKTAVYEQKTAGFLSNASLEINEMHTLGYGLDIENSESTRNEVKLYEVEGVAKNGYPQVTDKFPKTDVSRAGIFLNDEISLVGDELIVTVGGRFDSYEMKPSDVLKDNGDAYNAYDDSHFSVNLGALYKLTDDVVVFAQYGQGFKVPAYDLAYIDHDNSLYGYKVVPSDDLLPEESNTYELGLRGNFDNISFSGALFHTEYSEFLATDLIDIESSVNPYTGQEAQVLVYQYNNIDSVTIQGVEAGVRYYINDDLSVFTNASYQDGENDETGEYINSISPLSGTSGVSFQNENLSTELVFNWARRMDKVNEGNVEIAGYGTLDLLLSYQISDALNLNMSATNLTDKNYVRYINGAGHKSADSLDNLTEAGRSFAMNLSYNF